MGSLEGKVIVVTGASRGLGATMAVAYARAGATLVLASRSADDLESVAKKCLAEGAAGATVMLADVTDEAQVERLVGDVMAAHGRIDTFVANAGIANALISDKRYRELWTYDLDVARRIFDVNVFGTWLCMKHAIPAMQDGSSFIAVGSETGRIAYPGAGMYAVSKSAIDTMVSIASKEAAPRGVRVNCLSPGGMVDTHLFGPNKMPDAIKQHGVLPHDVIVPAALFLASDDSSDVTGMFVGGRRFNESGDDFRSSFQPARG